MSFQLKTMFVVLAAGVLGGCQSSSLPKGTPMSADELAVSAELKKVPMSDYEKRFKAVRRDNEYTAFFITYDLQQNRECEVMFYLGQKSAVPGWFPAVVYSGMKSMECDLKILSYLRPSVARKLSERFGVAIPSDPLAQKAP